VNLVEDDEPVPDFPKERYPVPEGVGRQYEKYLPNLEAVWETKEILSRPRPRRPAAPPKRPWLFCPQPKRKFGNASVFVRVRVSVAKKPMEKEESPYWMP
jgi:hypothetical protein